MPFFWEQQTKLWHSSHSKSQMHKPKICSIDLQAYLVKISTSLKRCLIALSHYKTGEIYVYPHKRAWVYTSCDCKNRALVSNLPIKRHCEGDTSSFKHPTWISILYITVWSYPRVHISVYAMSSEPFLHFRIPVMIITIFCKLFDETLGYLSSGWCQARLILITYWTSSSITVRAGPTPAHIISWGIMLLIIQIFINEGLVPTSVQWCVLCCP